MSANVIPHAVLVAVVLCVTCLIVALTDAAVSKTVGIEKRYVEIEDHGIKLRLTIVDTPGFNDMVDASQW